MTRRTLIVFAAVTLIVVVAAVLVQGGRVVPTSIATGELIFPKLGGRINDVAAIEVTAGGDKFVIEHKDGVWSVPAKDGYPARIDAVRRLLIGLAEIKTYEAKTRKPDLYARLEVEDASAKEAKSTRVTVADGSGSPLADLIVGKRHFSRGGTGPAKTYVRKTDEEQAWLAEGDLEVAQTPLDWTDKRILDVARDRIRRITLGHPDGENLVLEQVGKATEKFRIVDLPAGTTLKSDGDVNARASALAGLAFEDVRRAGEIPFDAAAAGSAEFRTGDGLVVRIRMAEKDDKIWLSVAADVDEAARDEPSAAAENERSGDGKADQLKPLDEVRQEAAQINSRAGGWAYVVPDYKLDYLRTRLADLIEKPDPQGKGKSAE